MILVTGGTGLVGSHLLYHLALKEEQELLAIYRKKDRIEKTKNVFSFYDKNATNLFNKITWVKADITEITSLEFIFSSYTINYVYHCAGLISFNAKDEKLLKKVNIYGTANLINLCIAKNIKKLCYVSSIATLGDSLEKTPINETHFWNDDVDHNSYAITKNGAEMEVWRASQEGLNIVIVNPGVIIGSGFYDTGSGKLFTKINNDFKFYTKGVTGYIGVIDVVKAMIKLVASPVKNERFILVSENISYKEVFFKIADGLGKKRPSIKIGKTITAILWRIEYVLSFFGRSPLITKSLAKTLHNKEYYSAEKIKTTLNFEFESLDIAIKKACYHFKN